MNANEIKAMVEAHNYTGARPVIKQAATEGRVYYDDGDLHNGGTAKVLVDGVVVGQASSLIMFDFKTDSGRRSGKVVVCNV